MGVYSKDIILQLLEISFIEIYIQEDQTCSFDALQLNVGSEVVSRNK